MGSEFDVVRSVALRNQLRSVRHQVEIKKLSLEVLNYDDVVGAIVPVEVADSWGLKRDRLYSAIDFKRELTELWKELCGGSLDSVWITFNQKPGMVFVSPQIWEQHKSSLLVK